MHFIYVKETSSELVRNHNKWINVPNSIYSQLLRANMPLVCWSCLSVKGFILGNFFLISHSLIEGMPPAIFYYSCSYLTSQTESWSSPSEAENIIPFPRLKLLIYKLKFKSYFQIPKFQFKISCNPQTKPFQDKLFSSVNTSWLELKKIIE